MNLNRVAPVLAGRKAGVAAEQLAEMGFVAETQMKGNIRHTEGVVGQQLAGLIQPQLETYTPVRNI